jgi:PTS system cellobiose-specific IIB component
MLAAVAPDSQTVLRKVESMKILVVCGAGASSTFVAQRLRRAAQARGLAWDAAAGMEQSIAAIDHDAVLVGPHLADRIDSIRSATDAPVAVLPDDIFDDREGERTLVLVQTLLADNRTTTEGRS